MRTKKDAFCRECFSHLRNSVDSHPLLALISGENDDDEVDAISLTVHVTGESSPQDSLSRKAHANIMRECGHLLT